MVIAMELTRFHNVRVFYNQAERYLLEREAEHNLILGICAGLMRYPERVDHEPYMAAVERGGQVVGVALMTPPHNLILSRIVAPEAIPLVARHLYREYKTLPGVVSSSPFGHSFAEEWQRVSGQSYDLWMAERIYQLEEVAPGAGAGVQGRLRRPIEEDRDLLVNWMVAFHKEVLGLEDSSGIETVVDHFQSSETQGLYLWEDASGLPVSMVGYSRPTPNGVCVVTVYTPPDHRKKGYASACVAALSRVLLEGGRRYCFLYTDLANPTSNHIYQAIGYKPVCDAEMYRFGDLSVGRG